jgi:type VI secretion system protein ImpE
MNAKDLIKTGQLSAARNELIGAVKSSPQDLNSRIMLFQVLAFCGEWEKARRHLEFIADQDASREIGAKTYLNLLEAEAERIEVLRYKQQPSFLPTAPEYAELYGSVRLKLAEREFDEARSIIYQIKDLIPEISGRLNGNPFVGFSNTDTQLSFFLEAFVHERYVWLPFETLRELSMPEPKTMLDLLWAAARVTTRDGLTLNCFLPVLYPDSFRHKDDRLKMGRMTDWTDLGSGFSQGVGQHVFQVGEEDIGILEIREAEIKTSELEKDDESGH